MEPMEIEALIALGAWYERYKNYRKDMLTLQHVFSAVEAATGHMEPAAPQVAIYALIDPRTLAIRYIGISGDPLARLQAHVQDKANGFKHEWLDELRQDGLVPIMRILEIVPSTVDALEREKRWIEACVSAGLDILNASSLPKREITQIAQRIEAVHGELLHTANISEADRQTILELAGQDVSPAGIARIMHRAGRKRRQSQQQKSEKQQHYLARSCQAAPMATLTSSIVDTNGPGDLPGPFVSIRANDSLKQDRQPSGRDADTVDRCQGKTSAG